MKLRNLAIYMVLVLSGATITAAGSQPIASTTAPAASLPSPDCGGCPPPTCIPKQPCLLK